MEKPSRTPGQVQQAEMRRKVDQCVPKLGELTNGVLFGDIWERPQLSKRDRSLITCATLVALGRVEQMPGHFSRALDNGVTREELVELVTHQAFYAGWPTAMSAALRLHDLFAEIDQATGKTLK